MLALHFILLGLDWTGLAKNKNRKKEKKKKSVIKFNEMRLSSRETDSKCELLNSSHPACPDMTSMQTKNEMKVSVRTTFKCSAS